MEKLDRRRFLAAALASPLLAELAGVAVPAPTAATVAPSLDRFAEAYTLAPGLTYLNHASIGTIPRVVQEAHHRYLTACETNPWLHVWGGEWEEPWQAVRGEAAALIGCSATDVVLTHNTTECFNLLAQGLPLGPGDEVLFSDLNHAGASVCWRHQAARGGFSVRQLDLPPAAVSTMSADDVVGRHAEAIGPSTRVLVLPHVDNTVGLRHPVAAIAAAARERGVRWVAVDGAQTVGMIDVDVAELGVDVYATSAHKWLQAPKGLGVAYLGEAIRSVLRPMWVTWGQERWRGSARVFEDYGTRNLPELLALSDAIRFQTAIPQADREAYLGSLREQLRRAVGSTPGLGWRSPVSWELGASLAAVDVVGQESRAVAAKLLDRGVVVRPFDLPGFAALRVSPNLLNDASDVDRIVGLLGAAAS